MVSLLRAVAADVRPSLVALVASWAGAFALLWTAAVGGVLGALVAAGAIDATGTTGTLFHVDGSPGLRPWHVVAGALEGAGGSARAIRLADAAPSSRCVTARTTVDMLGKVLTSPAHRGAAELVTTPTIAT